MSENTDELLRKALTLGEKDRALLAGALIESLHGECLLDQGREDEAETERLLLGALKIQREIDDADAKQTAARLNRLYRQLGRPEEARKYEGQEKE